MSETAPGSTVALVGGAGFIGHHLAVGLKMRGLEPRVIDSLEVNHLKQFAAADLPGKEFFIGLLEKRLALLARHEIAVHQTDARQAAALRAILLDLRPRMIVHLAAVSSAAIVRRRPVDSFDHSLQSLSNVLACASELNARVVYFSSSMVYGNFTHEETGEDDPLQPVNLYGTLKVMGEQLVQGYHRSYGLPFTIIRPSALYGSRCVSQRVIQRFIESALQGRPLTITGAQEKLDFTYIDDLVQGVCAAVESPAAINQIFNLTYGRGETIMEAARLVCREFPDARIEVAAALDPDTPKRGTLNIAKAARFLDYRPVYPLERGIPAYVSWYRGEWGRTARAAGGRAE